MYKKYFKRTFDIVLSFFAILFLIPVMLIVAVLVRIKLGSPVLYKVRRPGKDEKLFTMMKFRTMSDEYDKNGDLLMDNLRLTSFGKLLRSTSLDELPEFFNILKGDMSIVGPRPLATQYLPFYSETERERHSIRPGLTGLAQVNGRNAIDWETKFSFDLEYLDKMSLIFDLLIIFRTILKVFKKNEIGIRGIDAPEDFHKYRQNQNKKV